MIKTNSEFTYKSSDNEKRLAISHFTERLPARFHQAELFALSAEDHYLRVHTDKGEELILMRFSDAINVLIGADGLQTHRSWWVARSGIAKPVTKNGKYSLVLKSGTVAPISRSFSRKVRQEYFK